MIALVPPKFGGLGGPDLTAIASLSLIETPCTAPSVPLSCMPVRAIVWGKQEEAMITLVPRFLGCQLGL
jgi:hypothetical protein